MPRAFYAIDRVYAELSIAPRSTIRWRMSPEEAGAALRAASDHEVARASTYRIYTDGSVFLRADNTARMPLAWEDLDQARADANATGLFYLDKLEEAFHAAA